MIDTGLTLAFIIEGVTIATFASSVDIPVEIVFSGTCVLFSLATLIIRKSFKIFTIKPDSHDAIKLLAQSNLNSIAIISSQAM